MENTGTYRSNGATLTVLSIVAIIGAALGLFAAFSMPALTCDQVNYKWTDLASQDSQRSLDLCTKLGGETTPAAGMWVGLLAGIMFFGAGISAVVMSRRGKNQSAKQPSGSAPALRAFATEPAARQNFVQSGLASARTVSELTQTASTRSEPFTTRTMAERLRGAEPASFGTRVMAFLIDLAIMTVVALALMLIIQIPFSDEQKQGSALGGVYIGVMAATFVIYQWISALTGGTPGMRALGLRIIPVGRAVVDGKAAISRAVVFLLGSLILAGPFSGLWHREGRAWHDLCSGTGVVRLAD
jgi:uncharacterized RDD family membrane protein YckC